MAKTIVLGMAFGLALALMMASGVQAEHENGAAYVVVDDGDDGQSGTSDDIIVYTKDVSTSGATWVNPELQHGTHGADIARGYMFLDGVEVDFCDYPGLDGVIFCHTEHSQITLSGPEDCIQLDGQVDSELWGIHNFGPWFHCGE